MRVLGFDIATYMGMAYVDRAEPLNIVGRCVHFKDLKGPQRLKALAAEARRAVELWQPDKIVIEGFAVYRTSSAVTVIGCGTVVRQALYEMGHNWLEVPPSTLKKWCTGKGNAKKEDMALAVRRRWDYVSMSDDIIDAVALAQLGLHLGAVGTDSTLKGLSPGWI